MVYQLGQIISHFEDHMGDQKVFRAHMIVAIHEDGTYDTMQLLPTHLNVKLSEKEELGCATAVEPDCVTDFTLPPGLVRESEFVKK